jgi:hypothetical protein
MLSKHWKVIDNCKIFGNNHEVKILSGYELTKKERAEFDYLTDMKTDEGMFFRYKGNVYDIGGFMTTHDGHNYPFSQYFDEYTNDTFFSGILIKYCEDNDYIKVYTFYSE